MSIKTIIPGMILTSLFALPGCSVSNTPSPGSPAALTINIAATTSLTDALKEINAKYTLTKPNISLVPSFASSGTLQTQIQNGAPVDIFISAAAAQMDNIEKDNLIIPETRRNLLNNNVVLIVPADSKLTLTDFKGLTADNVKKIAIGEPKSVPAGTYALQAFDQLGIMAQLQPKLVLGADVRQVLTYVETANVDAGIVYSTDAMTSTKVKVAAIAPAEINAKVVYPVAVIRTSKNITLATDFENYLFGPEAKVIFEKYGFAMAK